MKFHEAKEGWHFKDEYPFPQIKMETRREMYFSSCLLLQGKLKEPLKTGLKAICVQHHWRLFHSVKHAVELDLEKKAGSVCFIQLQQSISAFKS